MYEWARLHGGAGTENLGTWCMSEDKREAMKLLGCDEKYDNDRASDFEMLAEWERLLPFCAGMGSVALYQKQLSLLGLSERENGQNICDFWRAGNEKLNADLLPYFTNKYKEFIENQGIDVFELITNIVKKDVAKHLSFLDVVGDICQNVSSASEHGAVLRFDAFGLSYLRPDRYHAELFWKKLVCDEKLNEEEMFVLRFQTLIEVLLFLKEKKIPSTLRFLANHSLLREQTISYLQNHHLMLGEIRFGVSLSESVSTLLPLCRLSNTELRILPELLLRPSEFGMSLVPSLRRWMAEFPISALRYGGLLTDSFSMALAAREVVYETLASILLDLKICDEKRQEILNTVFNL
ncbi:MAG: hypothetical protein IJD64_03130 [Clostridia bacterium]|nr:hypothetical protein [Clostridia bacterium]